MKNKNFIILLFFMILLQSAHAQTYWKLSGNSNATTSNFIGNTNAVPLYFKTNNTTRMSILSDKAFVGIGITTPVANIHSHFSASSKNIFLMTNSMTGTTVNDGFKIVLLNKAVSINQQEKDVLSILNNGNGITIDTNGYVGFNTTFPRQKIHVVDNNILISKTSTRAQGSTNGSLLFGAEINNQCPCGNWGIEYVNSAESGYGLNFWKPWDCNNTPGFNYALFLADNGNVGIGTNSPLAKLSVNGNICAKEIRVSLSGLSCWPDYVFDKDYDLMSIQDLEKYIVDNKHLPDVQSASVYENSGVELGEMNTVLLKKIEEMTMYIIQLEKRISNLEQGKNENKNF